MSVVNTIPAGIKPLGYEQAVVNYKAVGLSVPPGAVRAIIAVEENDVRWQDKNEPTSADGVLQKEDTRFEIVGSESIKGFKAIRIGFDWQGEWDGEKTYSIGDGVEYNEAGYVSIKDSPANVDKKPGEEPAYWESIEDAKLSVNYYG
jgi:hypothetical protein